MWVYKDNELAHHGVKNMKWGVRRYQNRDGSLTPAGKKRYLAASKKKKTINKTKSSGSKSSGKSISIDERIKNMSDADLKALALRIDNETKVKAYLVSKQKVSVGKKFVDKMLKPAIEEAATNATKKVVNSVVNSVVDSMLDSKKKSK